jgi:hypothetical protein
MAFTGHCANGICVELVKLPLFCWNFEFYESCRRMKNGQVNMCIHSCDLEQVDLCLSKKLI